MIKRKPTPYIDWQRVEYDAWKSQVDAIQKMMKAACDAEHGKTACIEPSPSPSESA